MIYSDCASEQERAYFKQLMNTIKDNGDFITVGRLLERSAKKFPDHLALIDVNKQITYQELFARAAALSVFLKERGIEPRDRVLLFLPNSIDFYVAYFAVAQIGAIIAPLNTFLKERELLHIIKDAKPALMIVASATLDKLKSVENGELPPTMTEEDLNVIDISDQKVRNFELYMLDPDELSVILYTSGTTGLPKGVMLSSRNILTNVAQGLAKFSPPLGSQERIFGVLPMFHSFAQFAQLWGPLFVGATVIIVPKIERRSILRGLKHKPTLLLAVPALYGLLCLMRNADLSSVRYFVSGGDALSDKIRSAFALIYRRKINSGYGLTETSPLIAVDFEDELAVTSKVGPLVVGMQAVLKDEEGTILGPGQKGELWVKGDNVMLGYYNAPKMTEAVLRDGWLCTGDLAYFDAKNNLIISGRTKDLIIHKGFNIYPQEIENVIMSHPAVMMVGVIGVERGDDEVPVAYVQLREPVKAIESELRQLCMQNLAAYKVPRSFICSTNALPTTPTGKVNKKKLKNI